MFWFIVDKKKLPVNIELVGPPAKMEKAVQAFKKKHKKTVVRKGKVWAKSKRKYVDAISLMKNLVKDEYVVERVKEIKLKK